MIIPVDVDRKTGISKLFSATKATEASKSYWAIDDKTLFHTMTEFPIKCSIHDQRSVLKAVSKKKINEFKQKAL